MRSTGHAAEYMVAQDAVGLWLTPSIDSSRQWVGNKGTRVYGTPFEVFGLPWLLVQGIEPGQWSNCQTGSAADVFDFDAGSWALLEGSAVGAPGDLLHRVFEPVYASKVSDYDFFDEEVLEQADSLSNDSSNECHKPNSDLDKAERLTTASFSDSATTVGPDSRRSTEDSFFEEELKKKCNSQATAPGDESTKSTQVPIEATPTSWASTSTDMEACRAMMSTVSKDNFARSITCSTGISSGTWTRSVSCSSNWGRGVSCSSNWTTLSEDVEACQGGEFKVVIPRKGEKLGFNAAAERAMAKIQSTWSCIMTGELMCKVTHIKPKLAAAFPQAEKESDRDLNLLSYKGHMDGINLFILGVRHATFGKGASMHIQELYDLLARPACGLLDKLKRFNETEKKRSELRDFREMCKEVYQEIHSCFSNLTAYLEAPEKAVACAALQALELSASALIHQPPHVHEQDRLNVSVSLIGSHEKRTVPVSRFTTVGGLRKILVENMGFPLSVRLMGEKEEKGHLRPLPPSDKLASGGTVILHGATSLFPSPSDEICDRRTQAELDWGYPLNKATAKPNRVAEVRQMFLELKEGFASEQFQDELHRLHAVFFSSPSPEIKDETNKLLKEHVLSVQTKVVAKYGYPGTDAGVEQMKSETDKFYRLDERLSELSSICQELLTPMNVSELQPRVPLQINSLATKRFELCDVVSWKQHLNDHGYVVISRIINEDQREKAMGLLWDFIEVADSSRTVSRHDVSTWEESLMPNCGWPANKEGIISCRGIGQSDVMWYLRTMPQLRQAFSEIYGTNQLLTSFDGANVARPYRLKRKWMPRKKFWCHVDQAHGKRGLHSIQGLVALTDNSKERGGLVVVPGSHKLHEEVLQKYAAAKWNFVQLRGDDELLKEGGGPQLVEAEAGDLILWDSRTIHCNTMPMVQDPVQEEEELIRAAAYVCMTPSEWCSEANLAKRRCAVSSATTTNHWPHEFFDVDVPGELGIMKEGSHQGYGSLPAQQKELVSPGKPARKTVDVVQPGEASFLPAVTCRVLASQALIVQAPYEVGTPRVIATVAEGEVLEGHAFGAWFRLSPDCARKVLGTSGPTGGPKEAWLFCGEGVGACSR